MIRLKRLLFNCVGILIIVAGVLSAFDLHGEYDVERTLWRINRDFSEVSKHPESIPNVAVDALAARYRKLIGENPKSMWAARAQMMLGNVYLFKKDYAQAREEFKRVAFIDAEDKELLVRARTAVASIYQTQGNWTEALGEYRKIIADYPLTSSGFTTPLLIGKYYESKGEARHAAAAYEEAAAFYAETGERYPKSIIEYNSLQFLILCRLSQKKWMAAVETSQQLMMQYPTGEALLRALKIVNVVCVSELHDYNLAINIFNLFINKYPNHAAVPAVKKMLEGLAALKSKEIRTP